MMSTTLVVVKEYVIRAKIKKEFFPMIRQVSR